MLAHSFICYFFHYLIASNIFQMGGQTDGRERKKSHEKDFRNPNA